MKTFIGYRPQDMTANQPFTTYMKAVDDLLYAWYGTTHKQDDLGDIADAYDGGMTPCKCVAWLADTLNLKVA